MPVPERIGISLDFRIDIVVVSALWRESGMVVKNLGKWKRIDLASVVVAISETMQGDVGVCLGELGILIDHMARLV